MDPSTTILNQVDQIETFKRGKLVFHLLKYVVLKPPKPTTNKHITVFEKQIFKWPDVTSPSVLSN